MSPLSSTFLLRKKLKFVEKRHFIHKEPFKTNNNTLSNTERIKMDAIKCNEMSVITDYKGFSTITPTRILR